MGVQARASAGSCHQLPTSWKKKQKKKKKRKPAFMQILSQCADSSLPRVLGLQFGVKCVSSLGNCLLWVNYLPLQGHSLHVSNWDSLCVCLCVYIRVCVRVCMMIMMTRCLETSQFYDSFMYVFYSVCVCACLCRTCAGWLPRSSLSALATRWRRTCSATPCVSGSCWLEKFPSLTWNLVCFFFFKVKSSQRLDGPACRI